MLIPPCWVFVRQTDVLVLDEFGFLGSSLRQLCFIVGVLSGYGVFI